MANPKKDTVKPEAQTPTPKELAAQRLAEVEAQQASEAKAKQETEEKTAQGAEVQRIAAEQKALEVEKAAKEQAQKAEKARKAAEAKAQKEAKEKARLEADPLYAEGLALLAVHPTEPEVHMTADNFGYFNHADARNHAATLRNKDVRTVTRDGDGEK